MFASCMPRVQLYVNARNGWPQFALQHHWLLPINCHFLRLYSAAGRGIAAVSSAIEESDLYLYFTFIIGNRDVLSVIAMSVLVYLTIASKTVKLFLWAESFTVKLSAHRNSVLSLIWHAVYRQQGIWRQRHTTLMEEKHS